MSRALTVAAAALPLLALILVLTAPRVRAADCAKEEVKVGIVEATGCFTSRTPAGESEVYETTAKFRMNGFDVQPHQGVKVTFSPAGGKRGASVTTKSCFVDLTAGNAAWGAIHFNNMNFAFSPPAEGEMILAESALAQPFVSITGLNLLSVKQPIQLTEEGAEFDLSFDLGGFFLNLLTGTEKALSISPEFEVKDGGYQIADGKISAEGFELAKLIEVNEATFELGAGKIDADVDAALKALSGKGLIAGFTYESKALTRARLGVSGLNTPLGASGIYLQKLAAEIFTAPPYGGKGEIDLTAGPKTRFFGKDVAAVEADGTVELRGADTAAKKPGFFKVGGDFSLVTLPVGNASFGYYFGQGTVFSVSFGIGLPSGRNDPGQPTYLGGGFNGWTTARHFDLEGNAKLKLLGIDLLGAQTVVSDIGFAGCVQVIAWVGGGVRWSDGRGELLGGFTCNIGGYRPARAASASAAADGSAPVRLRKRHRVVRVWAADGEQAPQVTLTHADGRTLASPEVGDEDGIVRTDDGAALRGADEMSAFVIDGDASGQWQLDKMPGSSDVDTIELAG